jgi:dTDP-4-dehydrorhamnose reductase
MKILIIGGSGMLGHQLWRHFHPKMETWVTLRRSVHWYARYGLFEETRSITGLDVTSGDSLVVALRRVRPDIVVNCVGVIKQLKEATDPIPSLAINSLLPHRLAELCALVGARLVHISTDCVFSGKKGNYSETDPADAEDLYGRSKYLGEVVQPHCITLRTSIIGRELESKHGLIEWFLNQEGKSIKGYRSAIYTGFTTQEMARIIEEVFGRPELHGLWQVSSNPISKYELLKLASDCFNWRGEIQPDESFICDRSLNSERFRREMKYLPPTWSGMLEEMAKSRVI